MSILDDSISQLEKKFGKGVIIRYGDKKIIPVEVIPTGCPSLDTALGIGGLPKGRIVEVYGPEACIAYNSFLQYEVWTEDLQERLNHNGGSIQRLYERFHGTDDGGKKQGRHLQSLKSLKFHINSINEENRIIQQEILDVVKSGVKECYKVSLISGKTLSTTLDHKYLTANGYLPLSDIKIGDTVYIHNNTTYKKDNPKVKENRPEIFVKYHPKAKLKLVNRKYPYYRLDVTRAYYEANLNNLPFESYRDTLNTDSQENINKMKFIDDGTHVHHIDENFTNNTPENLLLINPSEHGKLHATERHNNLRYVAVEDKVADIEFVGEMETYDIKCAFPYNNYIANGIVVHNSGKTTLSLHVMAECQKMGGNVAFIDVEHALDPEYASNIGVDMDNILISQPDSGEEALEIVETMVRSGQMSLIVIDSVAALVPRAEIDGEMGNSLPGLQARLMSQAMRKLTPVVSKNNCLVIFINQLRDKIGVSYGCNHSDNQINFVDGTSLPIRAVVENKIKGNVWTYNELTHKIEAKPITGWHYNGDVKENTEFIHFLTESIDGKGRFGFALTPEHKVRSGNKWVAADTLNLGDNLVSKYNSIMDGDGGDFIKGCLVGDSHVSTRLKNTGNIRFQDSNNPEYVQWKINTISNGSGLSFKLNNKRWESNYIYEFAKIKANLGNRNPLKVFSDGKISAISLAVWIMDDGHYQTSHKRYSLSVKRFKKDATTMQEIGELFSALGLQYNITKCGSFIFTVESSYKIGSIIQKYIPDCMKYKLPESLIVGKAVAVGSSEIISQQTKPILFTQILKTEPVSIISKRFASNRQMRQKGKYDISVKDTKNYMIGGYLNGVVIHNSPEVTTGGKALKFYASVRLDIRRIGAVKSGEDVIGNQTRVKVVKNKLSAPHKQVEFEIIYGEGISIQSDLLDLAVEKGIFEKKGAWFVYEGKNFAQGRDKARKALKDVDFFKEIADKLKELEVSPLVVAA